MTACQHLAIFIDGPLVGTMRHLPPGMKSWEVKSCKKQWALDPWDNEPQLAAMSIETVVYRPVMVGVGANAGLWAVGGDVPALDKFIKLIWPVLKLAESVEGIEIS